MSPVQISLLGRVQKGQDGYQRARYLFPDGIQEQTAFFGLALARRLSPARLVILGTTGSMWHILLELTGLSDRLPELSRRLERGSEANSLDPADLEHADAALSEALGCPVRLALIPYGRCPEEQVEILRIIAEQVSEGDHVALDVTHGLRHLPMLALLSALLLRSLRRARIVGIYYGALDLRNPASDLVPVLDLASLLAIADWSDAFARFEAGGDYGLLADQLASAGLAASVVADLRKASFCEQVCRFAKARKHLQQASRGLQAGLTGPAQLFLDPLTREIERLRAAGTLAHQRMLAYRALERGDWLRTVILLFEAAVTACLRSDEPKDDPRFRKRVAAELRRGLRAPRAFCEAFCRLESLRNALAHGRATGRYAETEAWLSGPDRLQTALRAIFQDLFPDASPTSAPPTPGFFVNSSAKLFNGKAGASEGG